MLDFDGRGKYVDGDSLLCHSPIKHVIDLCCLLFYIYIKVSRSKFYQLNWAFLVIEAFPEF